MTSSRSTPTRRGLLLAATVAALGAAPVAARAQPDDVHAHAEILSAEGDKHFALTEYEQAIASYREAYRRVPAPLLLFNIARSYRLLGACQQARTFFKNYLSTGDATYRERADQRVAAIDQGTDDKCIASKVVGPIATPPERVDPVGPVIGNTTGGTGTGGDGTTGAGPGPATGPGLAGPPPPDRGPTVAAELHPGRQQRIAGLVTLGVGVALAGTGGYFSVQARQAEKDVERACAAGCAAGDVAGRDADGKAAQRNASIFYAAAGVAVAAGAAVLVWGWLDGRGRAGAVALVPSRSGALAIAGWSF